MKYFFLILLLLLAGASFFYGSPTQSEQQDLSAVLATPSAAHLLGTDELGRDMLARILAGARVSLTCALIAAFLSGLGGLVFGSLAALSHPAFGRFLDRLLDGLQSIPDLLFYILIGLFAGHDLWGMIIALSSFGWISAARIVRGEILKTREMAFVEAARALGGSSIRLFLKHLLPHTFPVLAVWLALKIPVIIMAESTLSFIGLGLKPPHASWGVLLQEGFHAMRFYPHLIVYPSLFVILTLWSFNALGERKPR